MSRHNPTHRPRVGDKVCVRPAFGIYAPVWVKVDNIMEKNGCPVFGYTNADGSHSWAYFDQIVSMEDKP